MWKSGTARESTVSPMRTCCTRSGVQCGSSNRDEDTTLYIGPALSGELLEVVIVEMSDETLQPARIIHAMKLRPKFYKFL